MKRVPDNLVKYQCHDCLEQFIVSEYVAKKSNNVLCPHCISNDVEAIVMMNDKDSLNELGCLGIYHNEE